MAIQLESTFDKEALNEDIKKFSVTYFSELNDYLQKEKTMLIKFEHLRLPDIEYMRLFRFVSSAIDQLRNLDGELLNSQFIKFSNNLSSNIKIYKMFISTNSSTHSIFNTDYLIKHNTFYVSTNNQIDKTQKDIEFNKSMMNTAEVKIKKFKLAKVDNQNPIYKKTNKTLVDSLYAIEKATKLLKELSIQKKEYSSVAEELFTPIFSSYIKINKKELVDMINKKIFLLDKILWTNARKSSTIRNFFKSLVHENLSLATYIKYYLNGAQSKSISAKDKSYFIQCIKELQKTSPKL